MNQPRLLILAQESEAIQELINGLNLKGFSCTIVSDEDELANNESSDLLLIEANDGLSGSALQETAQRFKNERRIPIILLSDVETLKGLEDGTNIEDFILKPYNPDELSVRIKRLVQKNKPKEESAGYLSSGDIVIDLSRCEVSVAGKVVDLTFTEYELLKLLMSKKGHVLSREALLSKVWGYDYFGGDRTVDVHIARLRSKIEDPTRSFIETVRNIGYRIKAND